MGWPQYTWLGLVLFGLGIALAKDGQPRSPVSFWWSLVGTALSGFLLYQGGFFA